MAHTRYNLLIIYYNILEVKIIITIIHLLGSKMNYAFNVPIAINAYFKLKSLKYIIGIFL